MEQREEEEMEAVCTAEAVAESGICLQTLRKLTEEDEDMQQIRNMIRCGWPKTKSKVPSTAMPYSSFRGEMAFYHGIVMQGSRCTVPKKMRAEVIDNIHRANSGVEACIRLAREHVYWPGITAQVKDVVRNCDTCCRLNKAQQKEPMASFDLAVRPWQIVGSDICHFEDRDYLITVDFYSNFWEVDSLESLSSMAVIKKLKILFARYGIPEKLRTDNGRQFYADVFRDFATKWQFEHATSTPNYPQSNGRVENAVNIAKTLMAKAQHSGTDQWMAALIWRNTPTQGLESCPMQRLMNRRADTAVIPTTASLLEPRIVRGTKKECGT